LDELGVGHWVDVVEHPVLQAVLQGFAEWLEHFGVCGLNQTRGGGGL